MKRQFSLLLTSVLLVFALTACGGDRDTHQDNGQNQTGDSIVDDAEDALDDAGDMLDGDDKDNADRYEKDPASDDTLTDNNDADRDSSAVKQNTHIGTTYGQMLRNARVHDTDGNLKDMENAVTPGAA